MDPRVRVALMRALFSDFQIDRSHELLVAPIVGIKGVPGAGFAGWKEADWYGLKGRSLPMPREEIVRANPSAKCNKAAWADFRIRACELAGR
jgi:hypothetical protein